MNLEGGQEAPSTSITRLAHPPHAIHSSFSLPNTRSSTAVAVVTKAWVSMVSTTHGKRASLSQMNPKSDLRFLPAKAMTVGTKWSRKLASAAGPLKPCKSTIRVWGSGVCGQGLAACCKRASDSASVMGMIIKKVPRELLASYLSGFATKPNGEYGLIFAC